MRIHCLQHVPFESPALIEDWARNRDFQMGFTRFFENTGFPRQTDFDALVVMGGPTGRIR